MDLTQLVPVTDPLPLAPGFFWILLQLTFVLHLLFMNAMLGGGFVVLMEAIMVRGETTPPPIGRELHSKIPYTVAFTINLGVAPLLFAQVLYGQFLYTSTVLMAVLWLAVFALIIGGYYAYYYYYHYHDNLAASRLWPLLLAFILMIIVGFFFTNNTSLMQSVRDWPEYFKAPDGRIINWGDASLIPRYLHFVVSAVAVGGLFVAILGHFKRKKDPEGARDRIRVGMNYYAVATIINFAVGGIFMALLPNDVLAEAFGGGNWAALCMALSALLGVASVVFALTREVWPTTWCMVLTVVLMTLVREAVRPGLSQTLLHPGFLAGQIRSLTGGDVRAGLCGRTLYGGLYAQAGH
jgi:hypothetical protein